MNNKKIAGYVALGLAGLMTLTTGIRSVTAVPAGHVKVLDTFGSVNERELESGLHLKNPFSKAVSVDIRTQELMETMQVPTKEGLMATLDISILYKADPSKADEVYNTIGVNYEDVIITPNLRNEARDVIAGFGSQDLYNPNRGEIATRITDKLTATYGERGIILEDVLLRDIKLPPTVTTAIEEKIEQKQKAEKMEYVLQEETQEAERMRIEARGIADAQTIIAESLTQPYLQWKHIETLGSLANSDNTTFVMAPYDSSLTPLINVNK